MLQYTLKSWEGHSTVRRPYQLYDEDVSVPSPPKKGEIKVIIGGFPWYVLLLRLVRLQLIVSRW